METNGNYRHPNSRVQVTFNDEQINKLQRALFDAAYVANATPTGLPWINRMDLAGLMDPRRDIDAECGYPPTDAVGPDDYRALFDREPIANRVVDVMPKECWQVSPMVYETVSAKDVTDFEEDWDALGKNLSTEGTSWHTEEHGSLVWDYLYRADKLSGIGHFGIILLGIDDGKNLQEPIDGLITINWGKKTEGGRTRVINQGHRPILPDCQPTPSEIIALNHMMNAQYDNNGSLTAPTHNIGLLHQNPSDKAGKPGSWERVSRAIPFTCTNDPWLPTDNNDEALTANARRRWEQSVQNARKGNAGRIGFPGGRHVGFGIGPIMQPGVGPSASQGDVGAMGSFGYQSGTHYMGSGVSPFPPGSSAFQGTGNQPQKGGQRDAKSAKAAKGNRGVPPRDGGQGSTEVPGESGGAGNAPPYSPFIQGTDRQYDGSIPPGGGQSANPTYVGGHPQLDRPTRDTVDPGVAYRAQFVPQGHDPSTVFPSEAHAPMVPGYELGAGMGMPPAALSGTDQQYFGVQFGPSEQPSGRAGTPRDDDGDSDHSDDGPPNGPAPRPGDDGEEGDTSRQSASKAPRRRLLFLRVYSEELVQIVRYEWNVFNPRFGLPVMYRVTLNDPREMHSGVGLPMATVFVHWTRVIHLADNRMSSEIFGVPRLRPVLNPILDIQKIRGAGAEGYWKTCFNLLSYETHPTLGGDSEIDMPALQDMNEQLMNGLQRWIATRGMVVKSIAPSVVDPSPHINIQLESVAIQLGMPIRVLKGSERGELASSQDDEKWNDVVKQRQNQYCTPRIIIIFIDRLIGIGILSEPEQYFVEWPPIDSMSEKDKVGVLLQKTQAYTAYAQGLEAMIPPLDYMTKFDDMEEEVAQEILDGAMKAHEDETTMTMPPQVGGFDKEAPEGSQQFANKQDQQDQFDQQQDMMKQQAQQPGGPQQPFGGKGGPPPTGVGGKGGPFGKGPGQGTKTAKMQKTGD